MMLHSGERDHAATSCASLTRLPCQNKRCEGPSWQPQEENLGFCASCNDGMRNAAQSRLWFRQKSDATSVYEHLRRCEYTVLAALKIRSRLASKIFSDATSSLLVPGEIWRSALCSTKNETSSAPSCPQKRMRP